MNAKIFNELLTRIQNDTKAFDKLYNFYYHRIVHYLKIKYGKTVAEDVAHEFFFNLINGRINVKYVNYPTSWVNACCENLAKRRIAYDTKDLKVCADVLDNVDDIIFDKLDFDMIIINEMKKLDSDSQKILKLFYWNGYSLKEISQMLELNPATVRTKHRRAIKKLKKFL